MSEETSSYPRSKKVTKRDNGNCYKRGDKKQNKTTYTTAGDTTQIHSSAIVEADEIGDNVRIGRYCIIAKGARIGDNVTIADGVITTGLCYIGNNVNIRTGAIISKGVLIGDNVFIGPAVVTNHTSNLRSGDKSLTFVYPGAEIGSAAQIKAGVTIGTNVVVAEGANVTKDCTVPDTIYGGNPAKKIGEHKIHKEMLHKYQFPKFSREELRRL